MKRKILIALFMIASAVACAFGVTACQVDDEHIHDWGEWEITAPAGCETRGVETRVCKSDASHTETREIDTLGHLWGDGEITTDPTCEADGVRTFTCARDDSHIKTETEAKLGHAWDDGEITTDPTCEADGVRTFTCARDDSHTKTETEAKLGHAWDDGEITVPATCTEKGTVIYSCLNKDCTDTKTEEISALGHKYGEITSDEVYHWQTCERCNDVTEREVHTFGGNGLCTVCGVATSTTGLEFKVNSDMQSFSVAGIGEATNTDIVIPSSYKNLPVTGIAESAFAGITGLTSVTIPTTITSVGSEAFNGCTSLNEFTWNAIDCNDVGTNVFEGCPSLSTLTIGAMVNNIPVHTFANCQSVKTLNYKAENCGALGNSSSRVFGSFAKNVTELNLSANIRNVPDYAFYGFGSVITIDLPYTVTEIGVYAFYGCESLVSIGTTENATAIGSYAFYNCSNLKGMKISQNLTALGEYSFYGCSELNSSVVLNGLTEIEDYTFAYCAKLISVTIPDAITKIGDYAFYRCGAEVIWGDEPSVDIIGNYAFSVYKGTSLYIPDSVTEIGYDAFYAASFETLYIGEGVEYLRKGILRNCYQLTDLTIPFVGESRTVASGVSYYLGWIFDYSIYQGMIDEKLPDGIMQYRNNNGRYYYQIPESLTSVTVTDQSSNGEQFYNCKMLKNINFIRSISDFSTDLKISLSISDLKAWCEGKELSIEPSITELKLNGESITELIIPEGTAKIKSYAFTACPYVESLVIPSSGTSISALHGAVFYGGSCLKSISAPVFILSYLREATTDLEYTLTDQNRVSSASRTYFNSHGIRYNEYGNGCYIGTQSNPYYVLVKINDKTIDRFTAHDDVGIIADGALYGCANLTSISLPFIVKEGSGAFGYIFGTQNYNGSQAVEWNISYSRTTYYMPSSLRSVTLTGTTGLRYAFYNCGMITSVNLPEGITSIDSYAFYNCSGLTDFTLPDTVTTVGDYAFYGCSALKNLSLGAGASHIGASALENCTALENITVSDSNENYSCEDGILYNKEKTQFIHVPQAISGNITVPDSVTSIDGDIFAACSRVTGITVGENNKNYSSMDGILYNKGKTRFIYIPKAISGSITIPDGITSIGSNVFAGLGGLTGITLPDSVTRIGEAAFSGCSGLTSITLPFVGNSATATAASSATLFGYIFGSSGYTGGTATNQYYSTGSYSTYYVPTSLQNVTITGGNILYGAFYDCSLLTGIEIASSVTNIGSNAFYNCIGSTIYCEATSKPNGWHSNWNVSDCAVIWDCRNNNKDANGFTYVIIDGIRYGLKDGTFVVARQPKYLLANITIPSGVTYNNEAYRVTGIGDYAFENYSSLVGIEIPGSVTSIGNYAFRNCNSLTSISYTGSISEWFEMSGLGNLMRYGKTDKTLTVNGKEITGALVIPDGMTSIGSYAFYGLSGLTSIEIPSSVTRIGSYAFSGCNGLTSIELPNSVTIIGDRAFQKCSNITSITIPGSVTIIGVEAFGGCGKLASISYTGSISEWCELDAANLMMYGSYVKTLTVNGKEITGALVIPDGVTSIGSDAFHGCSGLTSITLPDSVTEIGSDAFYGCSGLTNITLPDSVTSIGRKTFYNCSNLTSITIPAGVTYIGSDVFFGCSSLTSITIPAGVTYIGSDVFSGCSSLTIYCEVESKPNDWSSEWNSSACPVIWNCKNNDKDENGYAYSIVDGIRYNLKDGIATILKQPVYISGAKTIPSSITYGNATYSVTSIGGDAFYGCSGLTNITIPDSITGIGSYAFYNCSGLMSIEIPGSVTSIGSYAFSGCDGLTIYCEAESKPNDWSSEWNSSACPVIWNCKNNDKDENGYEYTTVDGIKYSLKDGIATVVRLPIFISGAITIPSSVTYKNATYSVTSIGSYAFYRCSGLTSITIPNGVTSIGGNAFSGCSGLTTVYYEGSAEDWAKISISSNNSYLTRAMLYYYSETKPKLNAEGNYWHYDADGFTPVVWTKE